MTERKSWPIVTPEYIENQIIRLPGRPPAMIDKDLALIYQTETKRINQAIKRNRKRFPDDFMFQVTDNELKILLRSQSVPAMSRTNPHFFTREGANMLSAVLHSDIAIERSIQIMRVFTKLEKDKLKSHMILTRKLGDKIINLNNQIEQKDIELYEYRKTVNTLMHVGYTFNMTQIAKEVGFSSARPLNQFLKFEKVLYKINGVWMPYAQYADKGYFIIKQTIIDGGRTVPYHIRITNKGRLFILDYINSKRIPKLRESKPIKKSGFRERFIEQHGTIQ